MLSTKKYILSISLTIFESLDLLPPIILRAKILRQKLWKRQLNGIESILQILDITWSYIKSSLADSHEIVGPYFVESHTPAKREVHPGGIKGTLLTAKSTVAPHKSNL